MKIDLPFLNSPKQRKKIKGKKQVKRTLISIQTEHTPLEIQNMDIPELVYLYEHGSSAERAMAENVLHAREKWDLVMLAAPMDNELASGAPFANDRR
jgi:hypothetical protein